MNYEILQYLEHIRTDYSNWHNKTSDRNNFNRAITDQMIENFRNSVHTVEGNKYIKVVAGKSVHSFIVKESVGKFVKGDILKAASWAAPAKNFKRGNVLTGNYESVTWTGA